MRYLSVVLIFCLSCLIFGCPVPDSDSGGNTGDNPGGNDTKNLEFGVDEAGVLFIKNGGKFDDFDLAVVELPSAIDGREVKSVGNVFANSAKLERISFKNCSSVTGIPSSAFVGCGKLQEVVFPVGLQKIGNAAFSACVSLESVELPPSVTEVGAGAFAGCSAIASFVFADNNPDLKKVIGPLCFAGCASLESIVIPEGVVKIDDYLFYDCTALSCVSFPKTVETLGARIFADCRLDSKNNMDSLINVGFAGDGFQWLALDRKKNWNCREFDDDEFIYMLQNNGQGWDYEVKSGGDRKFYASVMLGDEQIDLAPYASRGCIVVSCAECEEGLVPLYSISSSPAENSHEYIDTGVHYNPRGTDLELMFTFTEPVVNTKSSKSVFFSADEDANRKKYVPLSSAFGSYSSLSDLRSLSAICTNVSGSYTADGEPDPTTPKSINNKNNTNGRKVYMGLCAEYTTAAKSNFLMTFCPSSDSYNGGLNLYYRENLGGSSGTFKYDELFVARASYSLQNAVLEQTSLTGGISMSNEYSKDAVFGTNSNYLTNADVDKDFLFKFMNDGNLNTIPLFCGKYIGYESLEKAQSVSQHTVEYANFVGMEVRRYKIYDTTGLERKCVGCLVPCKDENCMEGGGIGMYDVVSGRFIKRSCLAGEEATSGFDCKEIMGCEFDHNADR